MRPNKFVMLICTQTGAGQTKSWTVICVEKHYKGVAPYGLKKNKFKVQIMNKWSPRLLPKLDLTRGHIFTTSATFSNFLPFLSFCHSASFGSHLGFCPFYFCLGYNYFSDYVNNLLHLIKLLQ